MARTLVIAEVGSCHDGAGLARAEQLVEAARDAGADVVKFQFWADPDRLAERRGVPEHYRAIYRRYQMPATWLTTLPDTCAARTVHTQGRRPIEFMCTAYVPEDVSLVAPWVSRFKVASFEAMDAELRDAHAPFLEADPAREVIVSLGMGAEPTAWRRFSAQTSFLHCVSSYPTPPGALNLLTLRAASKRRPLHGFSDHSEPWLTWTGALAVAAGAEIVEAHIRLDDTDPSNPDAPHAMSPRQFERYVRHIRFAEQAMGSSLPQLQPCEREMAQYRVGSRA